MQTAGHDATMPLPVFKAQEGVPGLHLKTRACGTAHVGRSSSTAAAAAAAAAAAHSLPHCTHQHRPGTCGCRVCNMQTHTTPDMIAVWVLLTGTHASRQTCRHASIFANMQAPGHSGYWAITHKGQAARQLTPQRKGSPIEAQTTAKGGSKSWHKSCCASTWHKSGLHMAVHSSQVPAPSSPLASPPLPDWYAWLDEN